MSNFSGLTFESVFCGSDTPLRPSHLDNQNSQINKVAKSKDDLELFLRKTPLMILEEGAKGAYQQSPSWSSAEIPTTSGPVFEMTLTLRGKTVKARANSKKAGKQKAALEYLHQLINDGKRVEFFIVGETDEEARANINAIAEKPQEDPKRGVSITAKEVDKSIPTVKDFPPNVDDKKNWVGALQEKCQKLKLEGPIYDDCKIESNSLFIVTCTMKNQKTRGIKPKIKAAKNLAAWLMLKSLEEGAEAVQNFDLAADFEEFEVDERQANIRNEVFNTKDKKSALVELLSDKARFSEPTMDFKLPTVNSFGIHQIMLQIEICRPDTPDSDDLQMGAEHTQTPELMKAIAEKEQLRKNLPDPGTRVFSGHGSTEEEAIQSACKSALIHFHTYEFTD